MKQEYFVALALATGLAASTDCAGGDGKWTFENSVYMLGAGMSGDVTMKGISADLNVGFDDVLRNLEFGAMGKLRVARDPFSLSLDVTYMGLGVSKGPVSGDMDQWMVEPTVGFRLIKYVELLAGARYNNISGEIRGPFGIQRSDTKDWLDPIVGANFTLPLSSKFALKARADIGGFDVGSDLTWQAFPYVNWQISELFSVQAGYRWVYNDYEDGSGRNRFVYDVMTQGPQLGLTLKF